MDDMIGKIGELLSDGESMKQLSELAQMLMTGTASEETSSDSESEKETENEKSTDSGSLSDLLPKGFDFSSIMKIQNIMGAMKQKDKNSELLLALKPHLSDEKKEKIDKAIKILKLLAIWNIIKENEILKDLL